MASPADQGCFGLLATFEGPEELLEAVRRFKAAGYRRLEAYGPMPMEEVADLLGRESKLPLLVLLGGLAGGALGFGMQVYASVVDYPLNVGGRPDYSWPAFLVVTFELTILGAALTAVLGMLALNGLPRPHHPVFSVPGFERATRDRFFLLVVADDPVFDRAATERLLAAPPALAVAEVPAP
jgi:hypothetical protein